jgi:hypothetical protein
MGCIGILENLHRRGELSDLRGAYIKLLAQKIRLDIPTLQRSLRDLEIPPL